MLSRVRIAGVPEHFNLPWHMAMEEGAFEQNGIRIEWTDVPEGSGRMSQMLADNQTDLAIILTEGIIKAIADGLPAGIAQEFIASPLLWGIHVAADSPYKEVSELKGKTAAISRHGSGSHLMASVHAASMGWPQESLSFEIAHTLEGAISALSGRKADYFLWEKFTTQPVVDRDIFRRIGVCPTPWPCFVVAVRRSFASDHAPLLRAVLRIINTHTAEFRDIPSIDRTLANRYGLELEAVREWLSITRWSQKQIDPESLGIAIDTLQRLKLLTKPVSPGQILL